MNDGWYGAMMFLLGVKAGIIIGGLAVIHWGS